jgi:hypothetical protein
MVTRYPVYLECGTKRIFACAVDWPGWCRQGPNETEALHSLLAHGPSYASILKGTRLGFVAPRSTDQLDVVERLRGNAATDFGAIGVPPAVDHDRSCPQAELARLEKILRAGWHAFDATVQSARGKDLAKGPRGGGRSLEEIVAHVLGADEAYLVAVGWKKSAGVEPGGRLAATRTAILAAMKASAAGELPLRGPRGGVRWTARYFARRVTWHVIAHVWEIERRVRIPEGQTTPSAKHSRR